MAPTYLGGLKKKSAYRRKEKEDSQEIIHRSKILFVTRALHAPSPR